MPADFHIFRRRFLLIFCAFFLFLGLAGCSTTPKDSSRTLNLIKQNSFSQFDNQIDNQTGLTQVLLPPYLQELQKQPYISHGSRQLKAVALTFDADMTPHMLKLLQSGKVKSWYDERIVHTLRTEHVPATVFTTGMWAETYPQVLQSFASDPNFEIENHSYDHAAFTIPCYGLGLTQNPQQDIVQAQNVIKKISGVTPKFFRFPGGCFSNQDLELVHNLGLIPIQWDVISGDAYLKNPKTVIKQVVSQAEAGSIIIFHLNGAPNAPATADALPTVIQSLRAKGFQFIRLDQLLKNSTT